MGFYKNQFLFNKFVKTTILDSFFYFVVYSYLSFLSPYLSTLGWSESLKGIFFSVFSFVGIFAAPIMGTLSDKIGRYKILIAGLFLEAIGLIGLITTTSIVFLFGIRIISALAFSAVTITALSRVNDTVEDNTKRSRINGVFQSAVSFAAISAPLIGGFVADYYGYTTLFSVALGSMVIILLGLLLYDTLFYDDNRPHKPKQKVKVKDFDVFSHVKEMLKFKQLKKIAIIGAFANFAVPLMMLVIPFVIITKMGLSNAQLSIVVFVMSAGRVLQIFAGQFADKVGKRKTIAIGLIIMGVSLASLFFMKTFELILLILFFKSIGGALFNISMWSYMSDIAEANKIEGKVVGSYTSISRITMTISFAIGGFLLTNIGTKIFLLYGLTSILPVIIFSKMLFKKKTNLRLKS